MFLFVVVQTRGGEMPWLAREASLHGNGDGRGTYISRRVTPAITLPAELEPPLYAGGHHVRGDKGRLVYASYPPFRRWPLDDRVSCCVTAAFPAPPRTRAKASSIARLAVFGLASRCEVPTAHFALPATPFWARIRHAGKSCVVSIVGSAKSLNTPLANGLLASPLLEGRDATLPASTE